MSDFSVSSIESVLFSKDDSIIQNEFILRYKSELNEFTSKIEIAFEKWNVFDQIATKTREEADAMMSALLYASIHSHVVSMKIFISGLIVPSGNTQRYVLESIALALLLSRPSIGISKRYMKNRYSANNAVRDVIKNHKILGLSREGLKLIEQAMNHYHKYSHPSLLSIAGVMTVNPENPRIIFGGEFDEHKDDIYQKEIYSRISLAGIFPSIIEAMTLNYQSET